MGYRQSGQILLITLLVLTVATTIGLSLIGRATLDVSMSYQLEESSRAFNAAEAGIEEALLTGVGTTGLTVLSPGISYTTTVNTIGGTTGIYRVGHKTTKGVTEHLWLVEHEDTGGINESPVYTGDLMNLCWSHGTVDVPALVISVIYKEGSAPGGYRAARASLDPQASSRGNNFDESGILMSNGCGFGDFYEKQLSFSSLGITVSGPSADTLIALRVRPEYADTTIAINSLTNTLARQGKEIASTGVTDAGISRKIVVNQQYKAPSGIFDSVIFSQSNFQ